MYDFNKIPEVVKTPKRIGFNVILPVITCIINLDDINGPETHWVTCYPSKENHFMKYFMKY